MRETVLFLRFAVRFADGAEADMHLFPQRFQVALEQVQKIRFYADPGHIRERAENAPRPAPDIRRQRCPNPEQGMRRLQGQ
jgi:hypothetical protein